MKTAKGSTLCKSGLPFVKSQRIDNTVVKIAAISNYIHKQQLPPFEN
jgi:hypothetical protein